MYYSIKMDKALMTREDIENATNFWHGISYSNLILKQRKVKDEGTNRRSNDGVRAYLSEIHNQLPTVEKED